MGSLRVLALAGAAAVTTLTTAGAADLPPIIHRALPVETEFASGWYLRGDIGMSNQSFRKLDNVLFETAQQLQSLDKGGFDSAPFFGVGVGYQWNSWLRFDVTGEYRGKANFHALDSFFNPGTATVNSNLYTASKSEWVGLANVYFDLGTWSGFTPFVGAGVGFAHNTISHFRDVNASVGGVAYAHSASETNFAWAVHAGAAYRVTPAFTVELAYRYLNLGDARSGDLIAFDGTNNVNNPMHFRGLDSHDVKLGVRWLLDSPAPAPVYAPLMHKG